MKKYAFNEITLFQYIFLIFTSELGVGVLPFPSNVVQFAGTDSWISVILGWILVSIASLFIVQAMKHYPNGTLLDLLEHYGGKWSGKAGAVLVALYFAYFTYVVFTRTVLYIKILLPQTPDLVIALLLIIPFWFIARNGIRVQGRYAEIVFFMSCWMPLIFLYNLQDSGWLHLLPVLKEGWIPVFTATPEMVFTFLGFEMTFILYPFLKHKAHAGAGIVIANTLAMLVYLTINIAYLIFYSPDQIKETQEPALQMLKVIEFPFMERFDIVYLAFYLLIMALTWIPFSYCCVFTSSWLLGKKDHRQHLIIYLSILVITYLIYAPTFEQNEKMIAYMGRLGLAFAIVFPFLLWVYVAVVDRYSRTKHQNG